MSHIEKKKVLISCGPIPARLDSVKFITNRFKGGLAFKTAEFLRDLEKYDVTIIKWKFTEYENQQSDEYSQKVEDNIKIVNVLDVREYYNYIESHAFSFDAFILAAAVANLEPVEPFEGKFPSHLYKEGDQFDIRFTIAPRIIDRIKQVNPRATLIGYKLFDATSDEELIKIATHTLTDSKANVIFANHPSRAKYEKIALTQDGAAIKMNFEEHLNFIDRVIQAKYYRSDEILDNIIDVPERLFINRFESENPKHGTIAIKLQNNRFVTTTRGHKDRDSYSIIYDVDHSKQIIKYGKNKATLNAPILDIIFKLTDCDYIIHTHEREYGLVNTNYTLPGTSEETESIKNAIFQLQKLLTDRKDKSSEDLVIGIQNHGVLKLGKFKSVDWTKYYDQFPSKYFSTHTEISRAAIDARDRNLESLEIGGNKNVLTKYACDISVKAENAINLTWIELQTLTNTFDLIILRNSINYLTESELQILIKILRPGGRILANTFGYVKQSKVTNDEIAIVRDKSVIDHYLFLDDQIIKHSFFNRTDAFWQYYGFTSMSYSRNSIYLEYIKAN